MKNLDRHSHLWMMRTRRKERLKLLQIQSSSQTHWTSPARLGTFLATRRSDPVTSAAALAGTADFSCKVGGFLALERTSSPPTAEGPSAEQPEDSIELRNSCNGDPGRHLPIHLQAGSSTHDESNAENLYLDSYEITLPVGSNRWTLRDIHIHHFELFDEHRRFLFTIIVWLPELLRISEISERWYYTDVIVIRGPDEVDEFSRRIASITSVYPGEIILWKHDDDHIHLVHDCTYSSRRCRCQFRVDPFIATRIKKCPRRRRAITAMSNLDWFNILIYFYLQKRPSRGQVWIRGTHKRVPGEFEIVQWVSFIEGSLSVLERENPRINDQLQQELTRDGSRKWPHTKRKPISDYQRCNPETTAKRYFPY
ncbi:uncharacterized protein LOC126428087 [Schistocerca serialis cubense]|uniref:uncharacterized protein LOC126428087 n=1 Tax=Schistocerca serialis cubense TaxID=2023355 RepID=UPI00214F31A9|nr:uncharacterized protein LOC126428087 [Schistocerca serialis cubense]